MNLFTSNRKFVLFSYSISHGILLLRSGRTKTELKRIDVVFRDVRAIEVRAWFEGIVIIESNSNSLKAFASNPTSMLEVGNRVYSLRGKEWEGYILAGQMLINEDTEDFMAPSSLIEPNLM